MTMTFEEVRARVEQIVAQQSATKQMFKELAEMYWMEKTPSSNTSQHDPADLRLTKSPSSRNQVTGLHRLIRTTKPTFSMEADAGNTDACEAALDAWWQVSCERRRASVHSDLSLSAILFSDANLEVTAVTDLLAQTTDPVRKRRLTDLALRTPLLFEARSAMYVYPVWGDDGLSEYVKRFTVRGRTLREQWGQEDVNDNADYEINDYWNTEVRCVYVKGRSQPLVPVGAHGLQDIPCFSAVADGTDLFVEEKWKRQPFLYGQYQSKLYERENEVLTALFTAVKEHGISPLLMVDPDSLGPKGLEIRYAGVQPYIIGKGAFAPNQAFDGSILQLLEKLEAMGQESTIFAQTLGENIASGTPYSGYAMASQNGRLPLMPIQEVCEKVIHDAAVFALRYFKQENMQWPGLKATDVPDQFTLTVKLEVDLPQDQFRMAQIASQLQGIVSGEWIRTNLLQIHDDSKMQSDILSERAVQAAMEQDLPALVGMMMQMFQPPQPQGGPTESAPVAGAPAGAALPPQGMPPGAGVSFPGGPQAAMAGGQGNPMTEPMPPEQAVGGVA